MFMNNNNKNQILPLGSFASSRTKNIEGGGMILLEKFYFLSASCIGIITLW